VSRRREGFKGDDWCAIQNEVRHYVRRSWREQDAIAIVARREPVMRSRRMRTQDGKSVRGRGAKTGPRIDDRCVSETGDERDRALAQRFDGCGLNRLVEACVFYRRSDDGSARCGTERARNDVDVFGAERGFELEIGGPDRWNPPMLPCSR
jgi:hypothetical protein